MLTSKEVLERTGISRATLNNYIGSGLLPRPDVLPPTEGAAPRIGFFPDDTIERIAQIQRLKAQGWSLGRIAEHLAGGAAQAAPAAAAASVTPPTPAVARPAAMPVAQPTPPAAPSLNDVPPAAYTTGAALDLQWLNERARTGPTGTWFAWPATPAPAGTSVLALLLAAPASAARDSLLAFHVQVARQRGATAAQLRAGVEPQHAALVQARFDEALEVEPSAVLRAVFVPWPGGPAWAAYAVPMDRGTLFLYAPAADSAPAAVVATGAAARAAASPPTPELAEVAVLVAELQDAGRLWRQLPAQEYFELVHEIWAAAAPILQAHGASEGRHPGEGLVAYFLARSDRNFLPQALAAGQGLREAMRQLSLRWQQRKGWSAALCLNIGIAEGQEWIGSLRPSAPDEWTVLGDAAEQAGLMARLGRGGSVWATRSLVGKLTREQRASLQYGAPTAPGAPALPASFARLQDVAGAQAPVLPHEFADLAVAEVISVAHPPSGPASPGARRPHA